MTNDEMRMAIAEACGWRFEHRYKGSRKWAEIVVAIHCNKEVGSFFPSDLGSDYGAERLSRAGVPYYPADLNAMAKAVMTLDRVQRVQYCNILRDVIRRDSPVSDCDEFDFANAAAAQRAEAFLRTIGKWKEAKP